MNNPWLLLLMTGVGVYLFKLWRDDRRSKNPHGMPGATPASTKAIAVAVAGALVILAAETLGEIKLGLFAEQSKMTWLFALYSVVGAPVIEELIFRGWIVVNGKGEATRWAGIVGASLVFAVLHPFLWKWDDAFALTLTAKGWFSTGALFATSLWLYAARFGSWNTTQSLLPCFAAHAAKNLGVVAIKAAAGFMGAAW